SALASSGSVVAAHPFGLAAARTTRSSWIALHPSSRAHIWRGCSRQNHWRSTPMPEELPVFVPATGIHTVKAVVDALDIGWLGMGAFTQQFENKIGEYLTLDGRYVVTTNTGTSALHIALVAAGVGPGDEVIVPSFNFVADMQAITAVGARPVFCDIRF